MAGAFWVTAGKITANYSLVYVKMHPVETSHTLLPYTHAPQSTLPANSHVSTIHAGVPSQPHPHSHTHHYRLLHAHTSAPTVTLHVHNLQNPHTFHIPTRSGTSTFSQSQVTPTHAAAHVTHCLSHSRTPNRVLNVHPALGPLWPEAGPEWSGH